MERELFSSEELENYEEIEKELKILLEGEEDLLASWKMDFEDSQEL